MRYILDNEGYVELCSKTHIECNGRGCTEYTGEIPAGYSSLEDWVTNANIRAYKIVDGNLVFDANRDYKLRVLFEDEAFANGYVTRREMGITSTDEVNPYADLYPSTQAFSVGSIARAYGWAVKDGNIIYDASKQLTKKIGNLPVEEVRLKPYVYEQKPEIIEVEFIGNNFLPNTATSTTNNGISYIQNVDKTITANGTTTGKSTLNLAGTDTSVRNILTFKGDYKVTYDGETIITEHNNYHLTGLADGVSLEFYHYNGTEKTLIGIYKNDDIISFAEEVNVTQVVLTVADGVTINTTLKPMLLLTNEEKINWFNPETDIELVNQYRNYENGYVSYADGFYSLKIAVEPNTTYVASSNLQYSSYNNLVFYDANFNYLGGSPYNTEDKVFTTSENTYYISIALPQSYEWFKLIKYSIYSIEYEEYKNNTTLIDVKGYSIGSHDTIVIRDNQAYIKRNGYFSEEELEAQGLQYEYILLDNVSMPRAYTPYTYAYCHQKFEVRYTYKDPRNIDIKKMSLDGMVSVTNLKTEYNFTSEDITKARNYYTGVGALTDEEMELYDINGDNNVDLIDVVRMQRMVNGATSSTITGTLEIDSTQTNRAIILRDSEGNIKVSIGLEGIALGTGKIYGETVLFEGESNGDIVLSDNSADYSYIEIFYKNNAYGNMCSSVKVYSPSGKNVNLQTIYPNVDNKRMYVLGTEYLISGNTLTYVTAYGLAISGESIYGLSQDTISITRVVGYN